MLFDVGIGTTENICSLPHCYAVLSGLTSCPKTTIIFDDQLYFLSLTYLSFIFFAVQELMRSCHNV